MNIVFKDILPEHMQAAAHLSQSVLNAVDGPMEGAVASITISDRGQIHTLYLYAYTDGVITISYKEIE